MVLLNEEPLTEQSFPNARGLHASVKLWVKDVVSLINKKCFTWPFNAAEHTMPLVVGQEEYGWPIDFKVVDWNSFYIEKDTNLNINSHKLIKINRDDWYNKVRMMDYDLGTAGRNIPNYVFEAHGRGFGITPSPKEIYTIRFRYFVNPPTLTNWNDVCTIPEEWEHVIVMGVMYYMKLFKENAEVASNFRVEFKDALSSMRTILVNNYDYMQDTRIDVNVLGSNGR